MITTTLKQSIVLAVTVSIVACQDPTQPLPSASQRLDKLGGAVVVQVAAPTGNPATDIPNIQAAVGAATPGAVIQFAAGTYNIGDSRNTQFVVSTPGVTLQGDPRGTTLTGRQLLRTDPDWLTCCPIGSGSFVLNGGNQTVRGLNFDGYLWAISIGGPGSPTGGYRVENNKFRNGNVGVDFDTFSDDPSIAGANSFENVTAPVFILGKTAKIQGNLMKITDAASMVYGQPAQGVLVFPEFLSGGTICENNVIEDNTIVRYNEAIIFLLFDPSFVCRNNVIRGNNVVDARIYNAIPFFADNGSIALLLGPGQSQNNTITDNTLDGSEGIGLFLDSGTGNRIVGNTFRNLPGQKSTAVGYPGTGIILNAGASNNLLRDNQFKNVVTDVVDLGTGNDIRDASVRSVTGAHLLTTRGMRGMFGWASSSPFHTP